VVQALEATCRTPIAAHAVLEGDELALTAFVGLPDGSHWIRDAARAPADDPTSLGLAVAERLRAAGASELLATANRAA
jgi:hydroxymethylbilane synthase